MLKFLTHKLRSHSLNEDPNQEKTDDDHDSGTESDDEFQDRGGILGDKSSSMEDASTPAPSDSAVPSDSDFGAPSISTTFELAQRDSLDDIEDEIEDSQVSTRQLQQQQTQILAYGSRENELSLSLNYNDQHSSEEELEVINGPKLTDGSQSCGRPATAPEKRKWSQVSNVVESQCQPQQSALQQPQLQQRHSRDRNLDEIIATCSAPVSRAGREHIGSGSSDDEVQGLLAQRCESGSLICHPVQFRTSPPMDAHKPGRSLSPPPKLFHASVRETKAPPRPRSRPRPHSHLHPHLHSHIDHHHAHHHHQYHFHHQQRTTVDADLDSVNACSPRKRHRAPHRLPRPCLDFEKMQQLKTRAVTTWRHSGEHGNELSVFCW